MKALSEDSRAPSQASPANLLSLDMVIPSVTKPLTHPIQASRSHFSVWDHEPKDIAFFGYSSNNSIRKGNEVCQAQWDLDGPTLVSQHLFLRA